MPSTEDRDTRTQRERMLAGDPYTADDPELRQAVAAARARAARYAAAHAADPATAGAALGELLGSVGSGVEVLPPLYVDYGIHVTIGEGTFINYGLTALDVAAIRIGAHCQIGPHVQLLTPTHPIDPGERRRGIEAAAPITIADNVWLGGGVIVLPGVSIGENSVIGAGAVVTRDIPANVVAAGNPARILRAIEGAGA